MIRKKEENTQESGPSMEEKILAAAERLFLENGYEATSTTQIAREAGCNQALVHYYFRTKEKLFDAVLGGRIRQALRDFMITDAGDGNFRQKLTRVIEFHYDVVRKNSDMVLFLMNSLTRNPSMLESIIADAGEKPRQALKKFRNDLQVEIEMGRIRPISLNELMLNVVSLNVFPFAVRPVFTKVFDMGDDETEAMFDERKKEIVKTILQGLRP